MTCDRCGKALEIGDWPFCGPNRDHGKVQPRGAFEPHFDIALGEYVTGWGDVRQHMRRKQLDFRDHPSAGDLSARRDRIEQQKRTRGERAEWGDDGPIVHPPNSLTVDGAPIKLYDYRERPLRRQIGFTQ